MVRDTPERLLEDNDAIKDSLQTLLETLWDLLHLFARFLRLSPSGDKDNDEKDDVGKSNGKVNWVQLGFNLLLIVVVAVLYCYCSHSCSSNKDSSARDDKTMDSSSSSSSVGSPKEKSGWFSKYRVRLDLES